MNNSSNFNTDSGTEEDRKTPPEQQQQQHTQRQQKEPQQEPERLLLHILDVAGGKGEVSARLTMCHQQQVVMVDPRPADIVECYETLVFPKIPNKWQRKLLERKTVHPTFVQDTIHSRFRQLVTAFGDYQLGHNVELRRAVLHSKLILGLHADDATEAIVDIALQYGKPFVVVPCCVFPNLFQNRQIYDTELQKMVAVRSHEQFCFYLLQKDSRFQMTTLPFEGRNTAIYWDGR